MYNQGGGGRLLIADGKDLDIITLSYDLLRRGLATIDSRLRGGSIISPTCLPRVGNPQTYLGLLCNFITINKRN